MRRYLANLNTIDAKLCIGMGLLGLEDLLDGDRAERVSAAALSLSERLPKGRGKRRTLDALPGLPNPPPAPPAPSSKPVPPPPCD
jgi:hypothetical protein